jgi:hypothetical protein
MFPTFSTVSVKLGKAHHEQLFSGLQGLEDQRQRRDDVQTLPIRN